MERRILRSDRPSPSRLGSPSPDRQIDRLRRQLDGAEGTARELIDLHRLILRSPELHRFLVRPGARLPEVRSS